MTTHRITQRDRVHAYLAANPGSTIPEIRDGLAAQGHPIERVQARLDEIKQTHHLHVERHGEELATYRLGAMRSVPRGRTQLRFSLPAPMSDEEAGALREAMQATMDQWFSDREVIELADFLCG